MVMQQCGSLAELAAHFDGRLSALRQCVQLQGISEDDDCMSVLGAVQNTLQHLEQNLAAMKAELHKQQTALDTFQSLKADIRELQKRENHVLANLPSRLPNRSKPDLPPDGTVVLSTPQVCLQPARRPNSTMPDCAPTPIPSVQQIRSKAPALFLPSLDYLTVDEFQQVPKYMKGRLKYEQVNSVLDSFNMAVEGKYRLIHNAKGKKSEALKKQAQTLKLQETKDTKGLYFVTEGDLTTFGKAKLDASMRSVVTILRHCGRIKEIRGKGIVRYAIIV